jgi:hypothetical protein
MKNLAVAFVAAVTVLFAFAAVGAALPSQQSAAASFCSVSKGVAANLVNLENQLKSAPPPTRLKAEYGTILSAEPALRSSVPGSLKVKLNLVLNLANTIAADLKNANWNVSGLAPYYSSLTVKFTKAKPSFDTLSNYWEGTCKIKT